MQGSKNERSIAYGRRAALSRLRRIEEWRRARFQGLLADPDIDTNDPDRRKAIKAAKRYTEVAMRAKAIRAGIIER